MKRLQGMEEAAPAKINLSLRVLRRRDDGFHEIETRMAPISLYDSVQVEPAGAFEFRADDPALPMGQDNLVVRAADLFFSQIKREPRVRIILSKQIPGTNYRAQQFADQVLVNDLERPVFEKFVFLACMKTWLLAQGEVAAALMAGSGSTMFAILSDRRLADALLAKARVELEQNAC